jgi:Na+-driven multidrug efflux pump
VFQPLILGFVAVSTGYIFGTLLTANGSLKQLNIVSLAGLLINFGMNFLLIPKLMAVGSAYASLMTQFFTAALQVIVVIRIFKFHVNYKYVLTLLAYAGGVVLFNFISLRMVIDLPWLTPGHAWMPGFVLAILFSFLLAVALRLLSFRSLMNILRSER